MSAPAISVLLPCRNAAPYLAASITSLEQQTFADFEVIAVDDGSTDATLDMLRAWSVRDPRVHVLRAAGRGIVAALAQAAARARAPLLARMDADDVAHPDRFARQVALLADDTLVACGTRVRYFPRAHVRAGARRYEQWLNALTEPAALARDVFVECPIAHPALMMRRAAFDAVGGYRDRGWAEDYDLVLRLWGSGGRLANVAEVLLDWRETPQRLSRTDGRYSERSFQRCKAHHLVRTLVRGRPLVVCGAGPVGKRFARALLEERAQLAAFVDVDPRRIGQQIHGAPVVTHDRIHDYPQAYVVAAVAGAAARAELRALLRAGGRVELDDFCAVA